MMPETWLPTVTFTTGFSVPVAVTNCVKSPRIHCRRLILRRIIFAPLKCQTPPATTTPAIKTMITHFNQPPLFVAAINFIPMNCPN